MLSLEKSTNEVELKVDADENFNVLALFCIKMRSSFVSNEIKESEIKRPLF